MSNHKERYHNFSPGPATLPLEVLEKAQEELPNYQGIGASVMEISHRSDAYEELDHQARTRIKRMLGIGDDYTVLFLQGGASTQFLMAPYNYLEEGKTADYINTGRWSTKAIREAKLFGNVHVPFSSEDSNFSRVPQQDELNFSDDPEYVHFTSNNTVAGTQFPEEPDTGGVPLVCDASSDFLSRPIDIEKYGIIYAGAQKNCGPAGVTIVVIRNDFLEKAKQNGIPTMMSYHTHAEKIFNTPPSFNVYMVNLMMEWMEEKGGVEYFEKYNREKAQTIYDEIDKDDFYRGAVDKDSRSLMNITFRLQNEDLEAKFLEEAEENDLVKLKGHRSVGGIRASLYNACRQESVDALQQFMADFRKNNG